MEEVSNLIRDQDYNYDELDSLIIFNIISKQEQGEEEKKKIILIEFYSFSNCRYSF